MIDLHIHSIYSDGSSSLEEILSIAKEKGLTQIAITDHNILKGSILAYTISGDMDLVIGIELSVDYKGNEVHLLGYFPNGSPTNYEEVKFIISEGEAYKKIAILEMIENLNAMGFDINLLELSEFTKGAINRVHICKAMIKHGYISSVSEGFEKYIGDHCPAFVERKTVPIEEAAEAIHKDGGIAVMAHPYEYVEFGDVDEILKDVMDHIDGIECYHPSATPENSAHLYEIAKANNKIITGGSDFHGNSKPDISINQMNVSDEFMIKRN